MNTLILIIGKISPYLFVGVCLTVLLTGLIYRNKKIPVALWRLINYL